MAKIEPEGERERLARWYGGMEEEELKEIAKRQGSLTDVARRVIRAELLRRGLEVEQEELTELGAGEVFSWACRIPLMPFDVRVSRDVRPGRGDTDARDGAGPCH